MKPKYLYHGSIRKITKSNLLPKKSEDLGKRSENLYCAVYATNVKEIAIAMAIISCKGVNYAGLSFNKKPFGVIYRGYPKQKYIYLYTLSSSSFKKAGKSGRQWASFKSVKPIKVERLKVKDYLSSVKRANPQEAKKWLQKYKVK